MVFNNVFYFFNLGINFSVLTYFVIYVFHVLMIYIDVIYEEIDFINFNN